MAFDDYLVEGVEELNDAEESLTRAWASGSDVEHIAKAIEAAAARISLSILRAADHLANER